jgi:hypothetical protein
VENSAGRFFIKIFMKFIYFFLLLLLFLLPELSFSQEENDMCLALGAHTGIMPHKTREDGFERNSAVFTELEVAFNFNRRISISFNYDFASPQTRTNQDSNYYSEDIKGIALGLRYSPLKTRLKIFCEGQFFIFGSTGPVMTKESEWKLGSFGAGVNYGIGAKYSIIKQLDAFLKTKFNRYFYTITLGLNFNLPPPTVN